MKTIEISSEQMIHDMLLNLELGNICAAKGYEQQAIDHYHKGLQIAKNLGDKSRVQQFSNLILTYL